MQPAYSAGTAMTSGISLNRSIRIAALACSSSGPGRSRSGNPVARAPAKKHPADGGLACEELLEGAARQHQQERAFAGRRGDGGRAAVDQAFVPERLPRPREPDADAPVAAEQHLLD